MSAGGNRRALSALDRVQFRVAMGAPGVRADVAYTDGMTLRGHDELMILVPVSRSGASRAPVSSMNLLLSLQHLVGRLLGGGRLAAGDSWSEATAGGRMRVDFRVPAPGHKSEVLNEASVDARVRGLARSCCLVLMSPVVIHPRPLVLPDDDAVKRVNALAARWVAGFESRFQGRAPLPVLALPDPSHSLGPFGAVQDLILQFGPLLHAARWLKIGNAVVAGPPGAMQLTLGVLNSFAYDLGRQDHIPALDTAVGTFPSIFDSDSYGLSASQRDQTDFGYRLALRSVLGAWLVADEVPPPVFVQATGLVSSIGLRIGSSRGLLSPARRLRVRFDELELDHRKNRLRWLEREFPEVSRAAGILNYQALTNGARAVWEEAEFLPRLDKWAWPTAQVLHQLWEARVSGSVVREGEAKRATDGWMRRLLGTERP